MSPQFTPSAEETALVDRIFGQLKLGILPGDVALGIFQKTNLPNDVLAEIWAIADTDCQGWLSPVQTATALRLIGWAQAGAQPTPELLAKSGPLAHIPDISIPSIIPPCTPEDKAKFLKLFHANAPVNGLISGDRAREFFAKSRLPPDRLDQIWRLSDTASRDALDATDFTIAMHLIQGLMTGRFSDLPLSLPSGLYEQAAVEPFSPMPTTPSSISAPALDLPAPADLNSRRRSSSSAPALSLYDQGSPSLLKPPASPWATDPTDSINRRRSSSSAPALTLSNPPPPPPPKTPTSPTADGNRLSSPTDPRRSTPSASSPHTPRSPGFDFAIPPDVKVIANRQFDALDPLQNGFIHDNISLPFLLESKLPPDELARIWSAADINNDGKLTRDGFAIALYLIGEQRRRQQNSRPPPPPPLDLLSNSNSNSNSAAAPPELPPRPGKGKGKGKEQQQRSPVAEPGEGDALFRRASVMYPSLPTTSISPPSHHRFSSLETPTPKAKPPDPPPSASSASSFDAAAISRLTHQVQEQQNLITQLQHSHLEKTATITNLTQENLSLRVLVDDLQLEVACNAHADEGQQESESRSAVNEVLVKENEALRASVRDLQETLHQLEATSSSAEMQRIQHSDLQRENARLAAQVKELRDSTTTLPWSGGDAELQDLINEDLARENARLRSEAREAAGDLLALQEATAGVEEERRRGAEVGRENGRLRGEVGAMRRRVEAQRGEVGELRREVERLKTQLRARVQSASASAGGPHDGDGDGDVPPPSYEEAFG